MEPLSCWLCVSCKRSDVYLYIYVVEFKRFLQVYLVSTLPKMSMSFCVKVVSTTKKLMLSCGVIGIGITPGTSHSSHIQQIYMLALGSKRISCPGFRLTRTVRHSMRILRTVPSTKSPSTPTTKLALSLPTTSSGTVAFTSCTSFRSNDEPRYVLGESTLQTSFEARYTYSKNQRLTPKSHQAMSPDMPSDTSPLLRARRRKPLSSWAATSATSAAPIGPPPTPQCPAPFRPPSPSINVCRPLAPAPSSPAATTTPRTCGHRPSTS